MHRISLVMSCVCCVAVATLERGDALTRGFTLTLLQYFEHFGCWSDGCKGCCVRILILVSIGSLSTLRGIRCPAPSRDLAWSMDRCFKSLDEVFHQPPNLRQNRFSYLLVLGSHGSPEQQPLLTAGAIHINFDVNINLQQTSTVIEHDATTTWRSPQAHE